MQAHEGQPMRAGHHAHQLPPMGKYKVLLWLAGLVTVSLLVYTLSLPKSDSPDTATKITNNKLHTGKDWDAVLSGKLPKVRPLLFTTLAA